MNFEVTAQKPAAPKHMAAKARVSDAAWITGCAIFAVAGSGMALFTANSIVSNSLTPSIKASGVRATAGDGDKVSAKKVEGGSSESASETQHPKEGSGSGSSKTDYSKADSAKAEPSTTTTSSSDESDAKTDAAAGTATDAQATGQAQAQTAPQESTQSQAQTTTESQAAAPAQQAAEPRVHIVEAGDTLSSISAAYGVSVDAIANANGIRNVNLIYDGSALVIPNA